MNAKNKQVYLLPGMGADERMYVKSWRELEGVTFLNWGEYQGEKTIGEVADRLIKQYALDEDVIIGGSSLGGMVASEIAQRLGCRGLILIGSTYRKEDVNVLLRWLSHLSEITPVGLMQVLVGKAEGHLLSEMFADSDGEFIKAMCRAVKCWETVKLIEKTNVLQIHGKRDHVIGYPKAPGRKIEFYLIEGAGHLVGMRHDAKCTELVNSFIEKLSRQQTTPHP